MAANSRQPRRFTLADAMVLVAAVAVGLALSQVWTRLAYERIMHRSFVYMGPLVWRMPVHFRIVEYWPVVAVLSPTLLAPRTRRPRPSRRRLFAPPGLTACAAATIAIGLQCVINALAFPRGRNSSIAGDVIALGRIDVVTLTLDTLGALSSMTAGIAVAAVWGSTVLAGRWRPERSWLDRAGRVVGLLWLALIPIRLHFNLFCPCLSG